MLGYNISLVSPLVCDNSTLTAKEAKKAGADITIDRFDDFGRSKCETFKK